MGRVVYLRNDWRIDIVRLEDGSARLLLGASADVAWAASAPADKLARSAASGAAPRLRPLAAPHGPPLAADAAHPSPPELPQMPSDSAKALGRLLLTIDAELAGFDWERALADHGPAEARGRAIVRDSPVAPRLAAKALTLPLRFVQVVADYRGDAQAARVENLVDSVMRGFGAADRADAVVARTLRWSDLETALRPQDWPTADVLHFSHWPADLPADHLGATRAPAAGSAAWLERVAEINQTRLIVFEPADARRAQQARVLARQLVDRGGPAVLVLSSPTAGPGTFFSHWYDALIHDQPFDAALPPRNPQAALFGGRKREELLRVSAIGTGLSDLSDRLDQLSSDGSELLLRRGAAAERRSRFARVSVDGEAASVFRAVRDEMQHDYRFDRSEAGGLVPMARRLRTLREMLDREAPKPWLEADGPRHLHWGLRPAQPDTASDRIDLTKPLRAGIAIDIDLQIAKGGAQHRIVGDAALVEEQIHWSPDDGGAWLALGLTPLDFAVAGSPIQSFWLPREGDAEPVRFTVVPRRPGVAFLRWTLFQGNQVLRSYRLAAIVRNGEAPPWPGRQLAKALGIDHERIEPDACIAARLEYALSQDVEIASEQRDPVLSLVVNDAQGRTVITLKSGEAFDVEVPPEAQRYIAASRRTLSQISMVPGSRVPAYGFTKDNRGDANGLQAALRRLAGDGANLFNELVPGDRRQKNALRRALDDAPFPGLIQVAHVLLEHVVPWALVYDREFDEAPDQDDAGRTIASTVCLAALEDDFDGARCGTHRLCELSDASRQQRLERDGTVVTDSSTVCPLHFWGFRHVIELPPQQAGSKGASDLAVTIGAKQQVQMLRAINSKLALAASHQGQLDALAQAAARSCEWHATAYERADVRKMAQDLSLDLLYFYCHADAGADTDTAARLMFGATPTELLPRDLDGDAWPNRPLVFLNGCGTLTYGPTALSPFITTLVRDRRAAGVIGTEIAIWEALAAEAAGVFLAAFINGATAGDALFAVRHSLLKKCNPLGLVYTLYAAARLKLADPAPSSP